MSRRCPSCGTMFPDFAQVCARDGAALEPVLLRPRLLTAALGVLALSASIWAAVGLAERSLRSHLRLDVASVERSEKSLLVKLRIENGTGFAVDVLKSHVEISGALVEEKGKEEFSVVVPVNDTITVHWNAEITVHALGGSWNVTPSQEILLKLKN